MTSAQFACVLPILDLGVKGEPWVRLVRVGRILRLVRVARIMRLLVALRLLVVQIVSTVRACFWALVRAGLYRADVPQGGG